MRHDFDHDDDPAAAMVLLAAQAAVLAERTRLLRQRLADVDAQIQQAAEQLRRLRASRRARPDRSAPEAHTVGR